MNRFSKRLDALERHRECNAFNAYRAIQMPGEPEPEIVFDGHGQPHARADLPRDRKKLIIIRKIVDAPNEGRPL